MRTRITIVVVATTLASCAGGLQGLHGGGSARSSADSPATYWQAHARDGFMTSDDAASYTAPDGRRADVTKIDADHDGRVSQQEWLRYHGEAPAKSPSSGSSSTSR